MTIIKRSDLGRPLTWQELDGNWDAVADIAEGVEEAVQLTTANALDAANSASAAAASAASAASATSSSLVNIREDWRRTLADAGFNLVDGSFEQGGVVTSSTDALWHAAAGKVYVYSGTFPKTVMEGSVPDSNWAVVSDASMRQWVYDTIPFYFNSVNDMTTGTTVSGKVIPFKTGSVVVTLRNKFNIPCLSRWRISATQDTNTYSITIPFVGFANLICEHEINVAAFGLGGTDVENLAAWNESNRVARANNHVCRSRMPAGVFYASDTLYFDVDRRGFEWTGAGWDNTFWISNSNNISMWHVLIDPRNRARDSQHHNQKINGFTIDGNITGNGANAAQRVICSAHYSELAFKSVGHILSNIDICGLVIHWKGMTGGRINGATSTLNSVRVRYNSIKLDGYSGGTSQSTVNVSIHGPATTMTAANAIGDTVIPVASISGLYIGFIVELGGATLEAKIITDVTATTITLDSPLTAVHASGSTVRVPVYGTTFTGTVEVGQFQIGNCAGTEIRGMYTEETKFLIYAYAESLEIHGMTIGESAPTIQIDSTVDRLSTIRIVSNQTAFPININIADRSGAVNGILDLYKFPELDIQQNTRAQNSILVNGTYAFKSLRVERYYDTSVNDRSMTSFKFTGFSVASAVNTTTEILRFAQNTATVGYDGHTYNVSAHIKRATGLSGLLERKGQTSIIGSTISDTTQAASSTLNAYAFYNVTNGMDLLIASATGRLSMVLKGEPTGGQAIKAMLNGEIVNIL